MLGEYVNATQTYTYDVEYVRQALREISDEEPTDQDVIDYIEACAAEDFGYGDFILVGPDGEEL